MLIRLPDSSFSVADIEHCFGKLSDLYTAFQKIIVANKICKKTVQQFTDVRFLCRVSLLKVSRWDSIFFQNNSGTIETSQFKQLLWLQYQLLLPSLASYYLHHRSLLMSWHRHNIILLPFKILFKSMGTWSALPGSIDTFTSGLVCSRVSSMTLLSAAQTSVLLRGNEWLSLQTFAVTLQLYYCYCDCGFWQDRHIW